MRNKKSLSMRQRFMAEAVRETGVTVAAFARICDVPDRTLRSWLRGDREPSDEALEKIALGLERHAVDSTGLAKRARMLVNPEG